jgi:hypothetical protein
MMSRLTYYLRRARSHLKKEGFGVALLVGVRFLVRRKFLLGFLIESVEYQLTSRFRGVGATLISEPKAELIQSDRVLVYASYDVNSLIQVHVLDQLRAFHSCGYEIVFVTTSPELPGDAVLTLDAYCKRIIHRQNRGYDFCSWKLGLERAAFETSSLRSLVVMNDSCYGPFFEIDGILSSMRAAPDTVYGLTKSLEISPYIQSYFYHFGAELLKNGLVEGFFSRVRILNSKWTIVRFLEIGSSAWLRSRRIPFKALVDPEEPGIQDLMNQFDITDPVVKPVARIWIDRKLNPFYKRSNGPLV